MTVAASIRAASNPLVNLIRQPSFFNYTGQLTTPIVAKVNERHQLRAAGAHIQPSVSLVNS